MSNEKDQLNLAENETFNASPENSVDKKALSNIKGEPQNDENV